VKDILSRKSLRKCFQSVMVLMLLLFASAASFSGFYTRYHFFETESWNARRCVHKMIDMTADRPYVYRQLVPYLARTIDAHVPEGIKTKSANAKGPNGETVYSTIFDINISQDVNASFELLCVYIIAFIFSYCSSCVMYLLLRGQGFKIVESLLATVFLMLLIPYFMTNGGGEFYDYSELAFFCVSILLVMKKKIVYLVPVVILATFNKESYLFFVISMFPVFNSFYNRWKAVLASIGFSTISGVVYMYLRNLFAYSGGGSIEYHLHEQMLYFTNPGFLWGHFSLMYGILLPGPLTLVPLCILIALYFSSNAHIPLYMRRQAIWSFAITLPLFVLFCHPGEARNWSMLYPTLGTAICSFFHEISFEQSPVSENA
jgi:hypothetical protein